MIRSATRLRGSASLCFLVLALALATEAFVLRHPPPKPTFRRSAALGDVYQLDGGAAAEGAVLDAAAELTQDSCRLLGVRSIGVDYGLVRTGIAFTVGYSPEPLAILSDLNATELCDRIVVIGRTERAQRIVVGLPLHKNGTEAEQTNLTRVFAAELATKVASGLGPDVPVVLWDERYTSKEAAARIHARDPNQELHGQLDAVAACLILENYYNDNAIGAETVPIPPDVLREATERRAERRREEESRLRAAQEGRDSRMNWRKRAMEVDRRLEEATAEGTESDTTKRKKKKKKKKKK